jgi:hypothetical protein
MLGEQREWDRLKEIQNPSVCTATSNVKQTACFRVSSMVTMSIVARGILIPAKDD